MFSIKKINTKLFAVLVSVVVLFVTVFSLSSSKTNAGDITRKYKVYNATTRNYLREYNLTVEGNNTRTVIGNDDRVLDYTKNGVVKIITNRGYSTGFVVDDHTIATAAHCVYNRTITSILFFDQNGNNCMTITDPVEYHLPEEYIYRYSVNNKYTFDCCYYDYALITVEQSLDDYRCFDFGMMTEQFPDMPSNVISVSGFPGIVRDKRVNSLDLHALYTGTGNITSCYTDETGYVDLMYYNADTTNGDSGSPVYVTEQENGKMYYTVIGIYAAEAIDINQNIGTSFSPPVLKFLKGNTNINY